MAQSIKLGDDTYLDASGVAITPVAKYTLSDVVPVLYNATITTTPNGTFSFGININNYTPLFVLAWSDTYPNGIISTFIVTNTGAIWGRFTNNTGTIISSESINVRVGYMRKVSQT